MKEELITALAREYAEEECNKSTMIDTSNLYEDKLLEFYDVYGFLLRRYCLVEKSKVEKEYKSSKYFFENTDSSNFAQKQSFWERMRAIKFFFPEIAKEVEANNTNNKSHENSWCENEL